MILGPHKIAKIVLKILKLLLWLCLNMNEYQLQNKCPGFAAN